MLMGRLDTTAFSTSAKVVALPVAAGPLPDFDALDYPAILVGTDGAPERELQSVLQSRGFNVLRGPKLSDASKAPVLIVLEDYLAQPENRQRFDRIQAHWPQAPVYYVTDPADAVLQLAPIFS